MTPDQRAPVEREAIEKIVAEQTARIMNGFSFSTLEGPENLEARLKMCGRGVAHAILSALPARDEELAYTCDACTSPQHFTICRCDPTTAPDVSEERAREAAKPFLEEIDRLERDYGFDRPMHQGQCLMLPLSDLIAFRAAFAAQPVTVGEVSAVDAFEMGYAWRGMLSGQTLEDSRAVGRTLGAQIFEPLADAISREEKRLGFNPFQSADLGICEAKAIIRAALALPATQPEPVAAQGEPVAYLKEWSVEDGSERSQRVRVDLKADCEPWLEPIVTVTPLFRASPPSSPVDDPCPDCGDYGEYFGHADDCDSDTCALNGDIDSCNGQVFTCHCASSPSAGEEKRP